MVSKEVSQKNENGGQVERCRDAKLTKRGGNESEKQGQEDGDRDEDEIEIIGRGGYSYCRD